MKKFKVNWIIGEGRWASYSEIFNTMKEAMNFAKGVPSIFDSVWIVTLKQNEQGVLIGDDASKVITIR